MAVQLSVTAQSLVEQIGIQPQIILDIEGVNLIFAARPVFKVLEWDEDSPEAIWDGDLFWDGTIGDSRSRDWISLNDTTTNITQQIAPDKGSTSSISTVNVSIIDKDGEVSSALSFDQIEDILGRKAIFSIGFANGVYPQDANPIFRGIIVDFYTEAGKVIISMASPESIKRQLFLEKVQNKLLGTVVDLGDGNFGTAFESTSGFINSTYELGSYFRVNDEILEIQEVLSDTLLLVKRAQLGTVEGSHEIGDEVESFYVLRGKPLDLALKIMLSSEGNAFFESLDIPRSINTYLATLQQENAIFFDYFNIQEKTGLVVGDTVKLNSTLNDGEFTIAGFSTFESGQSAIIVEETLIDETEYSGTFSYKSKYNTLNTGLGMLTSEVDVEQFERIASQFAGNFVDYELYVKDSIDNAKDFIDQQIFFPQGLYSIPRKARSSVKFIVPPLTSDLVPYVSADAVLNANKIKQRRSVHKYHYNTYVFRYNVDSIEDKYLTGKIIVSANSLSRIPVGKKQLKIESDGLRDNPATSLLVDNIGSRLVERYQFAPVYYDDIEVNYKTGYTIEVGDVVPFGGTDLKITDLNSGARGSDFQLFEVYNKSLNVKNGNIKLSLVSTSFNIFGRYAVVSPSSLTGSGSTASRVKIKKSFDTGEILRESEKWQAYSGQIIAVRSQDFTQYEEIELLGVDPADDSFLLLDGSLSFIPGEDFIVEPAEYTDTKSNSRFKLEFGHFSKEFKITSVQSQKSFVVDNASDMVVGSRVVVHSNDFLRDSFSEIYLVDSVVGSLVTLDRELSFLPLPGDVFNNSNFKDGEFPYLII